MTPDLPRRLVLALMGSDTFRVVQNNTLAVAAGHPVQVDHGFSIAEVNQAVTDRAEITRSYFHRNQKQSFMESDIGAKLEWLEGLTEGEEPR